MSLNWEVQVQHLSNGTQAVNSIEVLNKLCRFPLKSALVVWKEWLVFLSMYFFYFSLPDFKTRRYCSVLCWDTLILFSVKSGSIASLPNVNQMTSDTVTKRLGC